VASHIFATSDPKKHSKAYKAHMSTLPPVPTPTHHTYLFQARCKLRTKTKAKLSH